MLLICDYCAENLIGKCCKICGAKFLYRQRIQHIFLIKGGTTVATTRHYCSQHEDVEIPTTDIFWTEPAKVVQNGE